MARPAISSSDSLFYYRHRTRRRLMGLLRFVIVFYVLYQLVTVVLVSSYSVASSSMGPGISPGNRLLVAPVVYGARIPFTQTRLPAIRHPRRGDVVLVRPSYAVPNPWYVRLVNPVVGFFTGQTVGLGERQRHGPRAPLVVARVVGIPGDTVEMRSGQVYIKPRGATAFANEMELVHRDYRIRRPSLPKGWNGDLPFSGDMKATVLAAHYYFVIGDDRSVDTASGGSIPMSRIVGMVIFRYWPLSTLGPL